MWLYNAWADRVEGHVSFTKTMKREEGCGKGEGQRGKRGKDISRGQTTCNIQWVTNCWVCNKTHSKNKNNLKDSKKNYTNDFVVFCVRERECIYVCLSWNILDNEPQECPPEARGGQRSMIPGPSTAVQEYWTTEVTQHWMTTVCSLKEYKNNYQCQKIFTNIIYAI